MDDPAAVIQQRRRRARQIERAFDHDVERRLPLGQRRVDRVDGEVDPSAVDERVQRAPTLGHLIGDRLRGRFLAVVARTARCSPGASSPSSSSNSPARRAVRQTSHPSAAKRTAAARPTPEDAPVMIARLRSVINTAYNGCYHSRCFVNSSHPSCVTITTFSSRTPPTPGR